MSRYREMYESLGVVNFFDYPKCKVRLDELKENIKEKNKDIGDSVLRDVYSIIKIAEQILDWNYRLEQKSMLADIEDVKGHH